MMSLAQDSLLVVHWKKMLVLEDFVSNCRKQVYIILRKYCLLAMANWKALLVFQLVSVLFLHVY